MNGSVLLTGGLGYIGSHISIELLNRGYQVIIVDNLFNSKIETLDKIASLTGKTPHFYNIDILTDYSKLENVFEVYRNTICGVIHLAGKKAVAESQEQPIDYYQNNITSTLNLLEIMRKNSVYNLIFSSSATVYGNREPPFSEHTPIGSGITNPYGKSKYFIEEILMDLVESERENDTFKWNIIALRYFNPVGNHSSGEIGEDPNNRPNNLMPVLIQSILNKTTLNIFGNDYTETLDGTCERDFIHVCDLATAHVKAIEYFKPGYSTYNIGTGKPTSVLELINTFENENGIKINYSFSERRPGDLPRVYCQKSSRGLGWEPQYSLKDICRHTWKYIIKNKNV
jgi:UDP-glucose 4-epimerase